MEPEKDSSSSKESWESVEDNQSRSEIAAAKCLFIGSEHFNPILALGCKDFTMISGAPRYHSLEEFEEYVPKIDAEGTPPPPFPTSRKQKKVLAKVRVPPGFNKLPEHEKAIPGPSSSAQGSLPRFPKPGTEDTKSSTPPGEPSYPIPGRRFLPHQLPVPRIHKKKSNVLTRMEECSGPLGALNQARLKCQRIQVWRRDDFGIRGYCSGFVVCFDKHWNLILKDVDEIFQRRRSAPQVSKKETDPDERQGFKSGQFLSEYSRTSRERAQGQGHLPPPPAEKPSEPSNMIRRGTPTGYLISGPENAVEVCRIGIRRLMLQGLENEKLKTNEHDRKSTPRPSRKVEDSLKDEFSPVTKSTLRKKQLVILRKPIVDFLGNKVVARTQLYEIVERHRAQIVLMGRSVAFVETNLQSQILALK